MMEMPVERHLAAGGTRAVLSIIALSCTFWLVSFSWRKRHFFKKAYNLPSAKTGPFGAIGDVTGRPVGECMQKVIEYFREAPADIFKVWLGNHLMVFVSNPEHLAELMTNMDCLSKSYLFDFCKPLLGEGIFIAPTSTWKRTRKLMNPFFNQKTLHSYIPIFQEKCDILIGVLEKLVGRHDIDIKDIISRYSLDTICLYDETVFTKTLLCCLVQNSKWTLETAMGTDVEAQTSDNRYGKAVKKYLELFIIRLFNILYHPEIIYKMTSMSKLSEKLVTEINEFSHQVITEQRTIFDQKMRGEYIAEEDDRHSKTLLSFLLELTHRGDHFSDKQMVHEVNTLIIAGFDTVSVAISSCLTMMGMHPEYQEKLYEEAIEVLGGDRYPTKEDLPKLKFTEMFIKETLRILPITPFILRVAEEDTKIGDFLIPKNSNIVTGVLYLHRNPKYWDKPLEFNPNRFLPENWSKQHPFSYVPFSGGLRSCIGGRYAMISMKLVLSKIVRKFKVRTDYKRVEDIELEMGFIAYPSQGFKVSLELRE